MPGRFTIRSDGTDRPLAAVAEQIEELANEIKSHTKDSQRVRRAAESIMHLAADIHIAAGSPPAADLDPLTRRSAHPR